MDIPRYWTFKSKHIAEHFDAHVRQQLPWYDMASDLAVFIARHFISARSLIYDIGGSTGNLGRRLGDVIAHTKSRYIIIDSSAEMKEHARPFMFHHSDATTYQYRAFNICFLFLVLMFIQPFGRRKLLSILQQKCIPGGVVIIFDRLEQEAGLIGSAFNRFGFNMKIQAGAREADVIRKELSLAVAQYPLAANEIESVFPGTSIAFKCGNFIGYVYQKPTE